MAPPLTSSLFHALTFYVKPNTTSIITVKLALCLFYVIKVIAEDVPPNRDLRFRSLNSGISRQSCYTDEIPKPLRSPSNLKHSYSLNSAPIIAMLLMHSFRSRNIQILHNILSHRKRQITLLPTPPYRLFIT